MTETLPNIPDRGVDQGENVRRQYEGSAYNVRARWEVYKHAVPSVNFKREISDHLNLSGTETVIDVGCGDGTDLLNYREHSAHSGLLIGLDPMGPLADTKNGIFSNTVDRVKRQEIEPISFMTGDAQCLPLAENSVDVIGAVFMMYHVRDPYEALREFQRVLKPDGRLVVATSGQNNKMWHREFEKRIAEVLGTDAPPIFSRRFNAEMAAEILPRFFIVEDRFGPPQQFIINSTQNNDPNYERYLNSLNTMRREYEPYPLRLSEWESAIETVVRPVIQQHIDDYGQFADCLDRQFFICRNIF